MSKKGFTVIEMMATFILVSAATLLLVKLALTVKEIYTINDIKTVLLVKQGNIMNKIYNDINNKTLESITSCDTNCIQFTYSDSSSADPIVKQLYIDNNVKSIRYGNYTYKLTDSNYINSITTTDTNNIFNLDISIKDRLVPGEFGLNIVFPTDLDIPSLTFDTTSKQNLVRNGDLSLKNNTNFSQFGEYENGYVKKTTSEHFIASTDEMIKIDPSKSYKISVELKSDNPDAIYYFGFKEYDIDYNEIKYEYMYYNDTLAYLTQDINKNDTVIHLSNTNGWTNSSDKTYQNGIIIWNYKNSKGEVYYNPAYKNQTDGRQFLAYSRNRFVDLFEAGSINTTNNTITLKEGWKGDKVPKDTTYTVHNSETGQDETKTVHTYLSQTDASSSFNYSVISNDVIKTAWKTYTSGVITGTVTNGKRNHSKFKNGTVYIKPTIYANHNDLENVTTYIKNITFKEV